jgi:hypothetical protein
MMPPVVLPSVGPKVGPLVGKAKVATIGILVAMGTGVLLIVAQLVRRRELVRFRDGEFVPKHRIDQVDHWVHVAAIIYLVGVVVGAACFIPWFHRAYKNMASWRATRFSSGWAIGGWFIPFANLVVPYLVAKDLATYSGPTKTSPTNYLQVWWACVVIGALGQYGTRNELETVDDFIQFDTIGPIFAAIWITGGACLIAVTREITKAQHTSWLRDL